jgi:SAM-dependent methyltransferase
MNDDRITKILEYYDTRYDEYGKSSKALDWGSREVQDLRFDVLLAIGPIDNCKILDVGCGLGDMYAHICKRDVKVEYFGYDINPRFVNDCRKTYPEATFEVFDVMEDKPRGSFDYIFSSGMFNVGFGGKPQLIKTIIQGFYEHANKGVACNFTSTLGDFQNPSIDYYNPAEIISSFKNISRQFVLKHDYLPHDFTVYLYK